jgi:hypothetical protein
MKIIRILPALLCCLVLLVIWFFRAPNSTEGSISNSSKRYLERETVDETQVLFSNAPRAFDEWLDTFHSDTATADLDRGVRLARERRKVLKGLIQLDPERALDAAVRRDDRTGLPDEIEELLEVRISAAAGFERVVSCYTGDLKKPEGVSEEERFVSFDDKRYRAFTYGRREGLQTKNRVSVFGIAVDDVLAVSADPVREIPEDGLTVESFGEIQRFESKDELDHYVAMLVADEEAAGPGGETDVAESAWTEGDKRILYLRVRFADDAPTYEPVTLATAQSHQDDVAEHYRIASYGKLNVTTVFPDMINLSQNKSEYVGQGLGKMMNEARDMATAMGEAEGEDWDYRNFDLYTIVSDRGIGSYAGIAQVGGPKSHHQRGYTSLRTSGHEFGHNLGLSHAYFNYTSDLNPRGATPTNGLGRVEYGHRFSVMSAQSGSDFDNPSIPHFTVHEKWRLDWLTNADMVDVTGQSQAGTYRLFQNDHEDTTGLLALRLPSGGSLSKYWLSYRTAWRRPNRGSDNDYLSNGILFNWTGSGGGTSTLLDMTPYSDQGSSSGSSWARDNSDKWDAPLLIGRTYTDPESKVSITPMARGGAAPNEYIDVHVHLDSGAELELVDEKATCRAFLPTETTPEGTSWTFPEFNDSAWFASGALGVGYDTGSDYQPYFGVNVLSMRSNIASCYIRVPFNVDAGVNLADLESLKLRMRYDDGFVAYLNGVKIGEANAPVNPVWNSGATQNHRDSDAVIFEDFNADAVLGALVNGANVLAIHGLNNGTGSSDFLIQSTLTASSSAPPNDPPEVSLAANTLVAAVNQEVTFTASGSDTEGDVLAFAWDFDIGDAFAPEGLNNPVAVRSWSSPGTYVVTITCSDRKGGIARDRVLVKVGSPPNDGVVSGRVLQGGQPVVGARVFVEGTDRQCLTLSDGSYLMAGLSKSSGTTLGAMFDGEVFQATVAMPVTPDPELNGVDFFAHGSLVPTAPDQAMSVSPAAASIDVSSSVQLTARIWDNTLAEDLLVPLGDIWNYLDTGVDPGSTWMTAGFDDSGWLSGQAELGYGDVQTTTVGFGTNSQDKHITTWFRRSFEAANVGEVSRLKLSLKRDDGARVFLNGTEIARDNLTTGTVSAETEAQNDVSSSNEEVLLIYNVDPALLIEGSNIIAAEIHQEDGDSSDLSFDLELSAARNLSEATPSWSVSPAGGSVSPAGVFTASAPGSYTVTATSGALSSQVEIFVASDSVVNIVALDDYVWENGGSTVRFEVTRTGSLLGSLAVPLSVGGEAASDLDFSGVPALVTLPIGLASQIFDVTILDDPDVEGKERLSVFLAPGGVFTGGASSVASVTILDDENLVIGEPDAGGDGAVDVGASFALEGAVRHTEELIEQGDYWKYLDSGVDLGSGWRGLAYDDSTWKEGLAKFGYGDNDETTTVDFGGASSSKYIATYFRRRFYLDNPADYSALTASVLADDGVVIYLNGNEVQRLNMPPGTITFSTRASGSVGGSDEDAFFDRVLDPSDLVAGENIITVEVHQSSPSSSDLGFDLALTGTLVSSGPAGAVRWTQESGAGTATFSDFEDVGSSVVFDQQGSYVLRLEDLDSGRIDEVTIEVAEVRNYQTWADGYPLADDSPLVDSDFDGMPNLLEYAFGGDPMAFGDAVGPSVTRDPAQPGGLLFNYRRLRELNSGDASGATGDGYAIFGISYMVEATNNLGAWAPAATAMTMQVVGSPVDNGDGTESVQLKLTPPPGLEDRWFVRLQISEQ